MNIKPFLSGLASLIFPNNCLVCKEALSSAVSNGVVLCALCEQRLELNTPPFCPKCSRHLENPNSNAPCPECQKHNFVFTQAWGTSLYNAQMKNLIHLFKYKNKTSLRHLFQKQMVRFINDYHVPINTFDGLVAVPLHPSKMRERQYNQSEILADEISRVFQVRVLKNAIVRTRATKPQALLNEKERWTNVKDAFRIRQPLKLKGRSILIIDDLMTTGATVCEVAQTLKNSGAKEVCVLTLAIA